MRAANSLVRVWLSNGFLCCCPQSVPAAMLVQNHLRRLDRNSPMFLFMMKFEDERNGVGVSLQLGFQLLSQILQANDSVVEPIWYEQWHAYFEPTGMNWTHIGQGLPTIRRRNRFALLSLIAGSIVSWTRPLNRYNCVRNCAQSPFS